MYSNLDDKKGITDKVCIKTETSRKWVEVKVGDYYY